MLNKLAVLYSNPKKYYIVTVYTTIDTTNQIFYNTSEKRFPPISHNIIPNSLDCNVDYLSSNEILNITPTSYYKQKISIPEHGQYHIYSSSSNLENPITCSKSFLFDNTLSSWLNEANKSGYINSFSYSPISAKFNIEKNKLDSLKHILPNEFKII